VRYYTPEEPGIHGSGEATREDTEYLSPQWDYVTPVVNQHESLSVSFKTSDRLVHTVTSLIVVIRNN
jgi:hypothetical protein